MQKSSCVRSGACINLWFVFIFFTLLTACATAKLSKSGQEKIKGKTFVITGASSGFGRGVAVLLGKYQCNVVLAARRKEILDEVASEVRAAGGKALVVATDVSKPDDVLQLAEAAVKEFGDVDVWINNAGIGTIGPFWDIPLEEHARVIDVNLKGVFYGSYAAMRLFRAQNYGTLINTGSVESEVPMAYQTSYAASKAGVQSLGNILHQELRLEGKKHIRVVTIMPWAADTPFWQHAGNHTGGTPGMIAMDGPEKIVNAIIYASLHRRRELPVGWKARLSYKSHHVMPHMTERIAANLANKYQMKQGPPKQATSGSIFTPGDSGTSINGGERKRMKAQKHMRK
jgi:short-subunit dehydrogenase